MSAFTSRSDTRANRSGTAVGVGVGVGVGVTSCQYLRATIRGQFAVMDAIAAAPLSPTIRPSKLRCTAHTLLGETDTERHVTSRNPVIIMVVTVEHGSHLNVFNADMLARAWTSASTPSPASSASTMLRHTHTHAHRG